MKSSIKIEKRKRVLNKAEGLRRKTDTLFYPKRQSKILLSNYDKKSFKLSVRYFKDNLRILTNLTNSFGKTQYVDFVVRKELNIKVYQALVLLSLNMIRK